LAIGPSRSEGKVREVGNYGASLLLEGCAG
jgi:hypothetical protein